MALVKFDRGLFRNGKKASGNNYGQMEPNQVWFTRAGMVEAQCALDPNFYSDEKVGPYVNAVTTAGVATGDKIVAQNGACVLVNKPNSLVTVPTKALSDLGLPLGMIYSSEQMYDERENNRRKFCSTTKDFLPRVGYLQRGMRITTNTVAWDTTTSITTTDLDSNITLDLSACTSTDDSYYVVANLKRFIESGTSTPVYAAVVEGSDGELVIGYDITGNDALGGVVAQLVAVYDNADRTCSFMFQIL